VNNNTHKLKQLNTERAKLVTQIGSLEKGMSENKRILIEEQEAQRVMKNNLKTAQADLKRINGLISKISNKELVVSEHAILRYLQRYYKVNLEEIQKELLTDDLRAYVEYQGDGEYGIGRGLKALVRNNTIVTIKD